MSVPCKHVAQFHERDLLCGLGDKTVLSVYVHLPPMRKINVFFKITNKRRTFLVLVFSVTPNARIAAG